MSNPTNHDKDAQVNNTKLWPVNQLLQYLDSEESHFIVLKPTQRIILIAILKFADNQMYISHPSLTRLCRITGLNRSTIKRNIRQMEKMGVIKTMPRKDKHGDPDTNSYKFFVDKIWMVGAFCAYPARTVHLPWVRSAPLTNQLTTHSTKNKKKDSIGQKTKNWEGLAETAEHASPLLDYYWTKNKL